MMASTQGLMAILYSFKGTCLQISWNTHQKHLGLTLSNNLIFYNKSKRLGHAYLIVQGNS